MKPAPGSQLALFATYSYHGFITDRDGETLELEADHRRHAEIENAIRDLKYGVGLNHLPSGRFAANGAWLAVQVMAHNLARWTARVGLGQQIVTTKTLRRRVFALAGRITPLGTPIDPASSPGAGPGRSSSAAPWPDCEPFHSQPDGARPLLTRQPTQRPRKLAPAQSASASCRVLSRHLARHSHCRPPSVPPKAPADPPANLPSTQIRARIIAPVTPSPPSAVLTPSIPVLRWIRAYVNAGRWLWRCLGCNSSIPAEDGLSESRLPDHYGHPSICPECATQGWVDVLFPRTRRSIETELLKQPGHRSHAPVRHWKLGWKIQELKDRTTKAEGSTGSWSQYSARPIYRSHTGLDGRRGTYRGQHGYICQ